MEAVFVFFFLWFLFSFYLIVSYLRKRKRARVLDGWAYCQGSVDESMVRDEAYGATAQYFPLVSYSYRVRGEVYKNDKISLSLKKRYRSSKKAEKITQKYPQGRAVTVYYDPDDPTTSILDYSVPRRGLIWGIALAVLWLIGVISFISMLPQ